MSKKIISVLLTLCFSITSYANCPKPVQLLEQGQRTNCKGYLFSPEKEKELYILSEDYKLLTQQLILKDKYIDLLKKDIDNLEFITQKEREKAELWRKYSEDSSKKLLEANNSSRYTDLWVLMLGVGLTVSAGFALGQINR